MTRRNFSQRRKEYARERLHRVARLKSMNAPEWVIKSEQIAMVLNRKGLKAPGIGQGMSGLAGELYTRHVIPLLENEE